MNRKSILSVIVLAASLAATPAVFAASYGGATIVNAAAKGKTLKFSLRNDSAHAMTVKVGGQDVVLAAGATVSVKAAIGETVTTEEASATSPAGTVLATVVDGIGGATIAIR